MDREHGAGEKPRRHKAVRVLLNQPQRVNQQRMQPQRPPSVARASQRWRKRVETVGTQLTERFAIACMRVHDLWHVQHRLIRNMPAHTVIVFLNLQLRRPPLDLDGLVVA
jgi:hypothetical protein